MIEIMVETSAHGMVRPYSAGRNQLEETNVNIVKTINISTVVLQHVKEDQKWQLVSYMEGLGLLVGLRILCQHNFEHNQQLLMT